MWDFPVVVVRMYGFKLEGGEWFKEGFHKLLSLEWNYFEIKDRENAHRDLYWFTLNPKLHPVFPETTGESTKQSTLDYLQHHQRSDLDPLKTHTSFGSAQTPLKMLILTTSRTHNTSQLHTQSFFKGTKDYTCYRKDLKSIQDENPISHSLDQSNLKAIFNSSKAKLVKKSNMFFLWLNLSYCLLHNLNKLFIAFKDWSKHLKLERIQL